MRRCAYRDFPVPSGLRKPHSQDNNTVSWRTASEQLVLVAAPASHQGDGQTWIADRLTVWIVDADSHDALSAGELLDRAERQHDGVADADCEVEGTAVPRRVTAEAFTDEDQRVDAVGVGGED